MFRTVLEMIESYREFKMRGEDYMAKLQVSAVYDEDMEKFLTSIDMLDDVLNGRVLCSSCSIVITLDNVLSIYPEDNEIKVCCTNWSCHHTIINRGG